MVNIKINDVPISVEEGTTILEACREAKMIVPTLCYLKDINEIGACRVCVVEIEGQDHLVTSCNNVVEEGMTIYTNSPKVRRNRKHTVEMILSQRQQHRNIFLYNNMSLPKCGILCHILHNSCNIMTKNMSHGINCVYTFHIASPLLLRCHICLLVYHSYCKLSLLFSILAFSDISHYNMSTGILIPTIVIPKFYDFRGDFP